MRSIALALLLAACTDPVNLPPPGDYTTWKSTIVTGKAPGHADSYRVIYFNDLAADPEWPLDLGYQEGSIIVKEIYFQQDGVPGELDYIALMRRIGPIDAVLQDQGGWLFSDSDVPNGTETHADFCWTRCHVAAPYNGAWYDYRKVQ